MTLLAAVIAAEPFVNREILRLEGGAQAAWHARAAAVTRSRFGREVFVRGVVEISNYCRENCAYCGMRRSNRDLARYRAHVEQLAELLVDHRPESMTDVSLQGGEDPVAAREIALPLIRILQQKTRLGVILCLGTLDMALYDELREAGAAIYILKFEMADGPLYERLAAPGTLAERLQHIRLLAARGWYVSSGFIAGLPGQTEEQMWSNLKLSHQLPLRGCSVSPFIPGGETPLATEAMGGVNLTLNSMAWLRVQRPEWVIPAVSALNLAEPGDGYRRGLRAGANLSTINLTPSDFRGDYVLYKRDRFIMTEERILEAIAAEGLVPSQRSLVEHYRAEDVLARQAGVADAVVF